MMKEWEHKVSQLQKEKEELSATLSDARSNANTNKWVLRQTKLEIKYMRLTIGHEIFETSLQIEWKLFFLIFMDIAQSEQLHSIVISLFVSVL